MTANDHAPATPRKPLQLTSDEAKTFGVVGGIAAVWIAATLLFGFGGLIIGALAMVALMFVILVWISRG
ncbi:MAG: hypothetical protein OIF40_07680 [Mangrovicoccus sp.]|nr:hypothetical protein [Mangrovicoccus sp.]